MRIHLPEALILATCLMLPAAAKCIAQGLLTIEGTATYRERMSLPPDAMFEATLEDVSLADAPSQVLGQARIDQPGNPPFHFSIEYDPLQVQPNHIYAVRGRIIAGDRTLFTTDQRYQVLTQGHGSQIGMMMMHRVQGQRQPASTAVSLRETYWKLESIAERPITAADQQREAYLILSAEDGRVTGSGGCNRIAGSYNANERSLRFTGIASTRMACTRGMDTESNFLNALEQVRSWKILSRQLELMDGSGKTVLRFIAQPGRTKP